MACPLATLLEIGSNTWVAKRVDRPKAPSTHECTQNRHSDSTDFGKHEGA